MKQFLVMFLLLSLVGCSSPNIKTDTVVRINKDMDALVTESAAPSKADAVSNACLLYTSDAADE